MGMIREAVDKIRSDYRLAEEYHERRWELKEAKRAVLIATSDRGKK
jgi:hypothetical protein